MSPRAAWRLEALGFEHVADYVGGKADWLGHGLPREGESAAVLYAGDLLTADDYPTCVLATSVADLRELLSAGHHGFCLVLNARRIVLGRVRRSALSDVPDEVLAGTMMEPGPSTIRPNTPASGLVDRLAKRNHRTAIITAPDGSLLGVFDRKRAELLLGR